MRAYLRKQLVDQSAHAAAAALVTVPIGSLTALGGAFIGLSLGVVREFTEWQWNPRKLSTPFAGPSSVVNGNSLLDYTFWVVGGVLGSLA